MAGWQDADAIRELDEDECWRRLATQRIGRLAADVGGRVDIYPITIGVVGQTVVFRTTQGTKLVELAIDPEVVLETDGITLDNEAWSVIVRGEADMLERDADIATAESSGLVALQGGDKDIWVRITPTEITGRAFPVQAAARR